MYNYSYYLSELRDYEKPQLGEVEKSLLFRVMNIAEPSGYKLASYFKIKRQDAQHKSELSITKRLQEVKLIKEVEEESFLRESKHFKLSSYGLFYIFSNTLNYSPQLLVNYQDDVVLKTLLFQYLQPGTIKRCTGRFYATITQYLNDSCATTINRLYNIKTSDSQDLSYTIIEHDLKLQAKVLAIKLTIMYSESNLLSANADITDDSARISLYELESSMKSLLSKDNRFIGFLRNIHRGFNQA
jgi:hypothetical protein